MIKQPSILLFRDASGNERLAAQLDAATMSFDLFEVVHIQNTVEIAASAIIITSRHAANYCVQRGAGKGRAFFVVGEETAEMIRQHEFGDVLHVAENAEQLMDALKEQNTYTHFTYVRGKLISKNICKMLDQLGFEADEHIVYELVQSDDELARLKKYISTSASYLIIPLLSQHTATVISEYLFSLVDTNHQFHAVAISDAVLQSVAGHPWQSRHVAEQANLSSLASTCLNCLDGITQIYEQKTSR